MKDRIIHGADADSAPPRNDLKIIFSKEIMEKYIPAWKKINAPQGLKYLALIMAQMEGFTSTSRSFRTNNPGNIGNTDNGGNSTFPTLISGIDAQIKYLMRVAMGKNKNYPLGKEVFLKPYFSPEIARNQKKYKLDPYCDGFTFVYTGELRQFIKIYSTGARQKNTYLSVIISYYKNLGITITERTMLSELMNR